MIKKLQTVYVFNRHRYVVSKRFIEKYDEVVQVVSN